LDEPVYRVSCRGTIDGGARARISLEFPTGSWSGEAMPPGQPFPSVTQLFLFDVAAASGEEAIETVREIVEGAGGHVDRFEAKLVGAG
jgi:hypothetical protein